MTTVTVRRHAASPHAAECAREAQNDGILLEKLTVVSAAHLSRRRNASPTTDNDSDGDDTSLTTHHPFDVLITRVGGEVCAATEWWWCVCVTATPVKWIAWIGLQWETLLHG